MATQPDSHPDSFPNDQPEGDVEVPGEIQPEMDPAGDPLRPELAKAELGGRNGPEPTRFGDWENRGVAVDF